MQPRRGKTFKVYDLSIILLLALAFLGAWLYGGPKETAEDHQQAFTRGVDNMLGGMGAPGLIAEYGGVYDDPATQARVEGIFSKVATVAEEARPELEYSITVLRSDVPNAFALPGGRAFITRGLVELLDDEDQIAGVLGHELAHVVQSHGSKAFGRDLGLTIAADIVIDRVDDAQKENAAQLARLGQALISTGYSRAAETEADEIGLTYAIDAGYAPLGLANALEKIEKKQKQEKSTKSNSQEVPEYFRTHPLTEDRVRHIRQTLRDMGYDVYVPGDSVTEALRRYDRSAPEGGGGVDLP